MFKEILTKVKYGLSEVLAGMAAVLALACMAASLVIMIVGDTLKYDKMALIGAKGMRSMFYKIQWLKHGVPGDYLKRMDEAAEVLEDIISEIESRL